MSISVKLVYLLAAKKAPIKKRDNDFILTPRGLVRGLFNLEQKRSFNWMKRMDLFIQLIGMKRKISRFSSIVVDKKS